MSEKNPSFSIHEHVSRYLEKHRREYIGDSFAFASYTAPHTMYNVSNELDEILLSMSNTALRMWHRTLSLLKRNVDPNLACTVLIDYENYSDVVSRNSFFKGLKELKKAKLLLPTKDRRLCIVNIKYANKLYKPKLEV